jgi:hypothetical protein
MQLGSTAIALLASWQMPDEPSLPMCCHWPAAAHKVAGHDAAVHRLRTLVASLKEGASFCKRLTAALPQLQALLANPAAGVVHDVIVLLTLCKCVSQVEVQAAGVGAIQWCPSFYGALLNCCILMRRA